MSWEVMMMLLTSSSSKTMIRENFKRYWTLPAVMLLAYFMIGMLPVIINYSAFANVGSYAVSFMSGSNIMLNLLIVISCVISSALVFSYLHDPVRSNAVHAMPSDRKTLYASSVLSGWLFVIIPIIIIAFAFLALRGAYTESGLEPIFGYGYNYESDGSNVFTLAHSLTLIVNGVITATNVFAICCISAVLAAKNIIDRLLSLFLIVLPNFLIGQVVTICKTYLYGFTSASPAYEKFSVLSYMMGKDEYEVSPGYIAYYLIMAIILYAAAYFIYRKVKLERVGQATTFPIVGDALCVILTFMISLGFSEIIMLFTDGEEGSKPVAFTIIALIASAVTYIVMRMIADSTAAIFNLKNLKKFGAYLGILAVFLAFSVFNITGFIGRMPEADDVASVELNTAFPYQIGGAVENHKFEDSEMIQSVLELQQAMIDTRKVNPKDTVSYTTDIVWNLKNGKSIRRTYDINIGKGYESVETAAKEIYGQAAFKETLALDGDKLSALIKTASLFTGDYYQDGDGEAVNVTKEDMKDILNALGEDRKLRTFDQAVKDAYEYSGDYCAIEVEYDIKDDSMESRLTGSVSSIYYIYDYDKNAFQILKDKGLYKK